MYYKHNCPLYSLEHTRTDIYPEISEKVINFMQPGAVTSAFFYKPLDFPFFLSPSLALLVYATLQNISDTLRDPAFLI